MESKRTERKEKPAKKYATLDAALKAKNDAARKALKDVQWPEKMNTLP